MKKKEVRLRRVEAKVDDAPSVYVLIYHDINSPTVFMVHGAYSSEGKILREIKRLSKQPGLKLTRSQKYANTRAKRAKKPRPFWDPMDGYSIREVTVQ